ncbi:hypothetical protein MSG28_000855 [Choristoneura fumiferana]|uniref:Uncharacterized protein n=1 Tax=Choristoneura fumiferana TaxID=7141 RepID=A0ACC0K2H3_CHOFU|nr:hypothetical protein MSG28_000855 [Choristoneura fumiferana]
MANQLYMRCGAICKKLAVMPGGGHDNTWTCRDYYSSMQQFLINAPHLPINLGPLLDEEEKETSCSKSARSTISTGTDSFTDLGLHGKKMFTRNDSFTDRGFHDKHIKVEGFIWGVATKLKLADAGPRGARALAAAPDTVGADSPRRALSFDIQNPSEFSIF